MRKTRPAWKFVVERLPRIYTGTVWDGNGWIFRIYGLKPWFRCCLVNYTKMKVYKNGTCWRLLKIGRFKIFETGPSSYEYTRNRKNRP